MTATYLSLVPDHEANDVPPSAAAVLEVLSEALRDRSVPACRIRAEGETASSDEGLSLVQGFLAIRDPQLRQALLHAVAALAAAERS